MNAPVLLAAAQLLDRAAVGNEKQKKCELGQLSQREVKMRKTRTMVKLSDAAQQYTTLTFSPHSYPEASDLKHF